MEFHIFSLFYYKPLTHTAPSAAPTSVSVSEVTSSSITVQWGAVPCIHRNGDITGYSVQYGVVGSESTQTMSVSGVVSGGMYKVSELKQLTNYTIKVAAVNSAGIGVYSNIIEVSTKPSERLDSFLLVIVLVVVCFQMYISV